jgi:signal transduction histidine kinase
MLDRLEHAQTRQRRFVADASHELRSPVASIRQHAEVALSHPERTTTATLAKTVLAEGLRVQQLVEDLLLLAQADERTLALRGQPLDLDDLVFEEARRLRAPPAYVSIRPGCRPAASWAMRPAFAGCCATWATTRPAMPAAASP